MDFDEIIARMENAEDYMDLYDAASYIVDDKLRGEVNDQLEQCEEDGDDVDVAYSVVTSDLLDMHSGELNESVEIEDTSKTYSTLSDYIPDIENASNDKDLLNVLNNMEQNKNLDNEKLENVRQLFKNNRFMPLNSKADNIIRYINEFDKKQESLTEATIIDNAKAHNNLNKDIDTDTQKDTKKSNDDKVDNDEILQTLKDRIGQQFSVAELNKLLQNVLGQQNKIFILTSDLSSMDLDKTQHLDVEDDDITYIIDFDIIDMEKGIVELTDITTESGE